jgi:hypothetical protein
MTKSQKLRTALKVHIAGVKMKKLQLKRKNPNATPEEIQVLYAKWVRSCNVAIAETVNT